MSQKGVYTHVPSEGPLDVRIVCLAETPWINEVEAGRPLAGASGNLLKRWWYPLGLQRSDMRLMNLFPYRPPTREIESVPAEKLIAAIEGIHERIAKLTDPYVIVTMGNYATYALTGKGKVKASVRNAFSAMQSSATEAEKKAGITSLRGSIYPYQDLNGRIIKVIPTIHPAGVLQMAKWEKRSIVDWGRIAREAQFKEIHDPGRQHIIEPSIQQIEEYCHAVYSGGAELKMAVDIETWGNTLSCVGFAYEPFKSITIPTVGAKYKDNLPYVKWLCECQAQKILCNGLYDWYWLDDAGMQLVNYFRDIQSMHHALDPAESHSLDFLASIYCPHYVYWKDEAKEAEEIVKYVKDLDSLWVYNGLDCCYTREIDPILEGILRTEGLWDFYLQHYAGMFEPLLRTMRHGLRVDVDAQKAKAKELRAELKELHKQLNEMAGEELFATEERTALREPTEDEWKLLLTDDIMYVGVGILNDKEVNACFRDVNNDTYTFFPPTKYINREARTVLLEQGLTYMMSGKNAGKIRYKVTKLKKDFSNDKLLEFFYSKLGLPKQFALRKNKGQKKKTASLDEAAIRKLMYRYQKAVEPGKVLLQYREKKKELDYLRGSWDKDGRMRCSYKMLTSAGRLSSSKNPMRRGMNMQNLKRN